MFTSCTMPRFHKKRGMFVAPSTCQKLVVCMVFGWMVLYVGLGVGRSNPELVLSSTTSTGILEDSTVSPFTGSQRCREINAACKIVFPAILSYPTTRNQQSYIFDEAKKELVANDDITYSLCTLKGHKVDSQNQDRSLLIETTTGFLAALFDGHGFNGEHASDTASRLLPTAILDALDGSPFPDFIKNIFFDADTAVVREDGGTTAFVILQHGDQIHLAWVGDSKAYLVRWLDDSSQEIVNKNGVPYDKILEALPHKPSDPDERLRIEKNGGQVFIPTNPLETSRVLYKDTDGFGREMQQALAMSRSLGDRAGKTNQVVTAVPSFRSFTLPSYGEYFVVLASDGVTDMISEEVLLTRTGKALFSNRHRREHLGKACQGIISDAADAWDAETRGTYRDDISLVIRRIETRKRTS